MIASMTRPSTSSITAAPKMILTSRLLISWSTLAVIPTLVAQSVAPINACIYGDLPANKKELTSQPRPNGRITPLVATMSEERPTFNRSKTRIEADLKKQQNDAKA